MQVLSPHESAVVGCQPLLRLQDSRIIVVGLLVGQAATTVDTYRDRHRLPGMEITMLACRQVQLTTMLW